MPKKEKINVRERLEDNTLDLSLSELTDVPVRDIASLKRATTLDLSNNKLISLPKNFGTLTQITKLDLSRNQLKHLPTEFGNLSGLRHLDLFNNKLEYLPLEIGNLKNLKYLDLKGNPLTPSLAKIVGPCITAQDCYNAARNTVKHLSEMQKKLNKAMEQKEKENAANQEAAESAAKKEKAKKEKKAKQEKKEALKQESSLKPNKNKTDTAVQQKNGPNQKATKKSAKSKQKPSSTSCFTCCFKFVFYLIFILALLLVFTRKFPEQFSNLLKLIFNDQQRIWIESQVNLATKTILHHSKNLLSRYIDVDSRN